MDIRLNKFISDSGYCSRREADRFIERQKVTINRVTASVGDKVSPGDVVKVNGNLIEVRDESVYIALNKPVGITCTTDTSDSTNVIDFVNYPTRIFHIGRLDKDSEGLILLTNNGDIVNKILREGNNHEKEYEVQVDKSITPDFIEKMRGGVKILGTTTKKCFVEKEGDKHFRIILTQGLNRQIRRMCEAFGYEVVKLRRVRIMNITLNKLPLEQWRFLEPEEVEELLGSIKDSKSSGSSSRSNRAKRFGTRSSRAPYAGNSPEGENGEAAKSKGKRPVAGGRSNARIDYKATQKSLKKSSEDPKKPFAKSSTVAKFTKKANSNSGISKTGAKKGNFGDSTKTGTKSGGWFSKSNTKRGEGGNSSKPKTQRAHKKNW
ncbi:MAG: 23S rRNA pseudouridine(2604) synthase RluF [Rikenellaceae bacterium]